MKKALFVFAAILLCGGTPAAQDLPPDILADQYLLEATEAMEKGEPGKASWAFYKIEALDIEPPPMFAYFYGTLLVEHGAGPENWRKGQSLLKQFVISAGRDSEHYTPTLKLLSAVEAKLEKAAREAQRKAKHEAQLKERLPEVLQPIDAQMVRVEGGTFTMGCTPVRRATGRRGRRGIVVIGSCAAAPGSTYRGSSVRLTATGTPPAIGTATTGSALPGRCLRSGVFTSLPPGVQGQSPWSKVGRWEVSYVTIDIS